MALNRIILMMENMRPAGRQGGGIRGRVGPSRAWRWGVGAPLQNGLEQSALCAPHPTPLPTRSSARFEKSHPSQVILQEARRNEC